MARHLGVSDIRGQRILADGQLRKEDGRLVMEVNEKASSGRKRFTIAHEIGHLLLANGGDFGCGTVRSRGFTPKKDADPLEERLCDFIAAEVLIPIEWAGDFTYRKSPGFDTIQAMASTSSR
jgi:Zn-dependent peptidase ImmA (M78 family)